jgi:hypothetical protein
MSLVGLLEFVPQRFLFSIWENSIPIVFINRRSEMIAFHDIIDLCSASRPIKFFLPEKKLRRRLYFKKNELNFN